MEKVAFGAEELSLCHTVFRDMSLETLLQVTSNNNDINNESTTVVPNIPNVGFWDLNNSLHIRYVI